MKKFSVSHRPAKTRYKLDSPLGDDAAREIESEVGDVFGHVLHVPGGGIQITMAKRCGGQRRVEGLDRSERNAIERILAAHGISKKENDNE